MSINSPLKISKTQTDLPNRSTELKLLKNQKLGNILYILLLAEIFMMILGGLSQYLTYGEELRNYSNIPKYVALHFRHKQQKVEKEEMKLMGEKDVTD